MSKQSSTKADPWAAIDEEKRRDRSLRRISKLAWTVTFLIVLIITVLFGFQASEMLKAFAQGQLPFMVVVGSALPLIIVLGLLSVLIATLSTIGIFLRLRTASLSEIQLRLSAIEEMLASRPDA